MRSPSPGCTAGSDPERASTEGRMLDRPGERCHTTKREAGRSSGRRATSFCSASMPPAEAPMTTMSLLAIALEVCPALRAFQPLASLDHPARHSFDYLLGCLEVLAHRFDAHAGGAQHLVEFLVHAVRCAIAHRSSESG